jgi:sulfite exporter TauE/SafE
VARTLAYAAGLAGVVAGGVVYQQGEVPFAVAIWILTFAVGALLMIAGFLLQAMTAVMARLAAIEGDLRVLMGRRGPDADTTPPHDWYR